MSNAIHTETEPSRDFPRMGDLFWELEYEFMGTPVLVTYRKYRGETKEEMERRVGEGSVQLVPFAKVAADPCALQDYLSDPQ